MPKRTLPVPSLSLKSLAQFLAPYPRNDKLWEQGKMELYEPLEAWDRRIRAGRETLQTRAFRQRYEDFYNRHKGRNSLSPLGEVFIWEEFQAFLAQTDTQAMKRKCIIDGLGATPDDTQRIQELCFIPTVLFPCVLEIAKQLDHLHKAVLKEKKSLKNRINQLRRDDLLTSGPLKTQLKHPAARAQKEFELIEHVFKVKYPPPKELKKWRAQWGLDKGLDIENQKHRIWGYICRDLVDCLKPYLPGRRQNTKKTLEVPTKARNTASRLLHLSAPDLWPDGPKGEKAVERWYRDTDITLGAVGTAAQRAKRQSDKELGIGSVYEVDPEGLEKLIKAGLKNSSHKPARCHPPQKKHITSAVCYLFVNIYLAVIA